uniref:Phosphatidylinositol-3-phosphatase SAC1 n=1 Tax=Tabanus bromius TaxID=304241 RepID=A0A0K8TMQ9_TABBR
MAEWSVHDDMYFYATNDYYVVEPNGKKELLIIDRISGEAKVQAKTTQLQNIIPERRICGVLGSIKLIAGHYLIVATHRLFVGMINGQAIWSLAGYDILPYATSLTHLSLSQQDQNEAYLNMLRKVLDTPFLYFSYSYDLTHTLQRLQSMPPDFLNNSLFARADQRFVWNGFCLRNFHGLEFSRFCLPLMLGFVSINQASINNSSFAIIVISRRSVQRAGTRLFCRGIDENGHCANYIETEQIVEYDGEKVSFVQTRGSIPLFWRQTPNLKYKPAPQIIPGKDHFSACIKHFDAQLCQYGRQVLINLIDHRGAEDVLEKAYSNIITQLNNSSVRYEAFDFHSECRKMRWDRLNILIDRLAHEQDEFSMFHLRSDGTLISSQDGVFRTNCIDCLDRTNVVQSMLARRSLTQALTKLGILNYGQKIDASSAFEMLYKAVWADNADLISMQYSGTGALKTDFTRTGKRTKLGLMKDGVNSLTRYYLNNFNDGFRQDAIDLFLGNYIVQSGEGSVIPSPLVISKGWKYGTFPSVLLFAVAMFFASSIFPHEYNTENLLFLLFWGAMVGVTSIGIFKYWTEFVDWPKLLPPVKVETQR